jgi:hypothetical protein
MVRKSDGDRGCKFAWLDKTFGLLLTAIQLGGVDEPIHKDPVASDASCAIISHSRSGADAGM